MSRSRECGRQGIAKGTLHCQSSSEMINLSLTVYIRGHSLNFPHTPQGILQKSEIYIQTKGYKLYCKDPRWGHDEEGGCNTSSSCSEDCKKAWSRKTTARVVVTPCHRVFWTARERGVEPRQRGWVKHLVIILVGPRKSVEGKDDSKGGDNTLPSCF